MVESTTDIRDIDVRGTTHEEKERLLFPEIDKLEDGSALRVVFDFYPLPLVHMLQAKPGLTVTEEKTGPPEWVLLVHRRNGGSDREVRIGEHIDKDSLKLLLKELRRDDVDEATISRAKEWLGTVDATTLGLLEQELINDGVSHDEIRKSLCDVHLEAMRDALVEKRIDVPPLHPVHTLMEEHRIIVDGLHRLGEIVERMKSASDYEEIGTDLEALEEVSHLMVEAELHHQREEEALFPRLKRYGVSEPPAIMEEEHVEFRQRKRELFRLASSGTDAPFADFKSKVIDHGTFISRELESHIFKEDNILYQIALQLFSEEEWRAVKRDCDKIGYCCFKPQDQVAVVELDLRPLPPAERHTRIFAQWGALPEGGVLRITNDHDPKPLYYQFEAEHTNAYTWEYEQEGPVDWVVRIGRTEPRGID